MFKFDKKFLFVVFAICLFAIGLVINNLIQNGLDDPIFTISILLSLIISSTFLYTKIYRKEKKRKKN